MIRRLLILGLLAWDAAGEVPAVRERTQKDKDEELFKACRASDPKRIEKLIASGANPNAVDPSAALSAETPLLTAIEVGAPQIVAVLLKSGADVRRKDSHYGWTPLDQAANRNAESAAAEASTGEIIKLLLDAGADPNEQSPLSLAVWQGPARMRVLIDHGAKPGFRELASAVRRLKMEEFETLLAAGAKPHELRSDRRTLLHELVGTHGTGSSERVIDDYLRKAIERLLELGVSVNAQDSEGETALHFSAENGDMRVAQMLLNHKADVSLKDNQGATPLLRAANARVGCDEMVRLLVAHGAAPDAADSQGRDVFAKLVEASKWSEIIPLLEVGLRPAAPDRALLALARNSGETTAPGAFFFKLTKWLMPLIKDPNMVDDEGLGLVSWAVRADDMATLKFLLEQKLDCNLPDHRGRTPLIWAALCTNGQARGLLLAAGAKQSVKDENGRSADDYRRLIKSQWSAPATGTSDGKGLTDRADDAPADIFAAVMRNDLKLLRQSMAEHPASLDELRGGMRPVQLAAALGRTECFDLILRSTQEIATNEVPPSALAMRNGHAAPAVRWLRRRGQAIKPNEVKATWNAGLENKQWRAVKALLEAGMPPGDMGWSLLSGAARAGEASICRKLLDLGVPVLRPEEDPCVRSYGDTVASALETAMGQKDVKLARMLAVSLSSKPVASTQAALDRALSEAAVKGNLPMVKMLLADTGADPKRMKSSASDPFDPLNANVGDPLLCAVEGGNLEIVRLLVTKGADPTRRDGRELLTTALRGRHVEVFDYLMKHGVDPLGGAERYDAPLYEAVRIGDVRIVKELLAAGANPCVVSSWGDAPDVLAERLGFVEIEELLQKAVAVWQQQHPPAVTSPEGRESSQKQ